MPVRLVPLTPGTAPAIALQRPVILVGRHPECDARLDLPQVSRRHCCLAQAYDRLLIRDLGSRHGVRVNGRVVQEATLHHGDEVAIAQLLYRLEDTTPRPPAPPPPAAAAPAPKAAPGSLPDLPAALIDDDVDLVPLDDDLPGL